MAGDASNGSRNLSMTDYKLLSFMQAGKARAGLLVRDMRSSLGLGQALRISLGLPEQNDRLLQSLQ